MYIHVIGPDFWEQSLIKIEVIGHSKNEFKFEEPNPIGFMKLKFDFTYC